MSEAKQETTYNPQVAAALVASEQPVAQQQPVAAPQHAAHSEGWNDGLFDCCGGAGENLCLKGTFCPCFVYGKTQARLHDPSLGTYERINSDCLIFLGAHWLCNMSCLVTFFKRGDLRRKYGIKGDGCTDFLSACCCNCCAVIQHEKEVIHQQKRAAEQKPEHGYQAPDGMVAPN